MIIGALDYVGVLGVEFFVTGDDLLVNEIAPRVHNSGHWTEAVCVTDQFEQHIRAICGWPLGDPHRLADVVMENLIGDEVAGAFPRASAPAFARSSTARPKRDRAARWAISTISGRRELTPSEAPIVACGPMDRPGFCY